MQKETKVKCSFCGKTIQSNNLYNHYNTKSCIKSRDNKISMLKQMRDLHKKYHVDRTNQYNKMIEYLMDKLAEATKQYLDEQNRNKTIECECGECFKYEDRLNHHKSDRHQDYIDKLMKDNHIK